MKLFAIFGNPIEHSKSPLMHNMVFKNLNFDACYSRILLKDGTKLRDTFFDLGLVGANITVPHKEAAFIACDEIRGFANKVGVVNTIIKEGEKLIGYNTDADGFLYAIDSFKNIKKVLIIGAGGTAKALIQKFLDISVRVSVLNRSQKRLDELQQDIQKFTWEDFKASDYDLVINTTSAGLTDENLPAPSKIIDTLLKRTAYVADVIYGKETPFLKQAKQKGIDYKDGSDMLLAQGVLANEIFTNHIFTKKDIEKEMKKIFVF